MEEYLNQDRSAFYDYVRGLEDPEEQWQAWLFFNQNRDYLGDNTPVFDTFIPEMSSFVSDNAGAQLTDASMRDWYIATNRILQNDEDAFKRWSVENPVAAIRYHALSSKGGIPTADNTGYDKKWHLDQAEQLAALRSIQLGLGEDGKENGKAVAWNYKDFDDINTPWTKGDFKKLGQLNTLPNGFNHFVKENPELIAGGLAGLIAPWAAPAIAGATGLSAGVAGGLLTGGATALAGGSLEDSLLAGAGGWLTGGGLNDLLGSIGVSGSWADRIGDIAGNGLNELSGGSAGGSEPMGNDLLGLALTGAAGALGGYLGGNGGGGNGGQWDGDYRAPERVEDVRYQPVQYDLPQIANPVNNPVLTALNEGTYEPSYSPTLQPVQQPQAQNPVATSPAPVANDVTSPGTVLQNPVLGPTPQNPYNIYSPLGLGLFS